MSASDVNLGYVSIVASESDFCSEEFALVVLNCHEVPLTIHSNDRLSNW